MRIHFRLGLLGLGLGGSLLLGSCSSTSSSNGALPSVGAFQFQKTLEPIPGFKMQHYFAKDAGLNVYLIQTPGSGVFTPVTAFGVGSRNEIANRTGLAHLFEHMMFRGTPSYDAPFKTLSDWGGQFNAYTSDDVTVYFQTVPKHLMSNALKFESERMRQLKITPEGYQTERQAVVSERKLNYEDNPQGRARFELHQLAFDRHPYKTTPIGWQEDLDATSFQEALDFYKKYYAPNRAQMVLIGDFEIKEALTALNKYYGNFKAEAWSDPQIPQEKARIALRRKVIDAKSENVLMIDAVLGLRYNDKRVPADTLLCDLLAEPDHGYLSKELVEKNHATRVYASCQPAVDPPLNTITVAAAPGVGVEKIEGLYLKALEKFPQWLTEDKVKRMKLYYLTGQYASLRNPTSIGKEVAHIAASIGDPEYMFKMVKSIESVTREQILARFRERGRFHPTRVFIKPSATQAPLVRVKK